MASIFLGLLTVFVFTTTNALSYYIGRRHGSESPEDEDA